MQTVAESPAPLPSSSRQLPERILVAAHQSIDLGDLDMASKLLGVVERLLKGKVSRSQLCTRRNIEGLVAAYQRIWDLRHPDRGGGGTAFGVDRAASASLSFLAR